VGIGSLLRGTVSNHLAEREIEVNSISLTYKLAGEGRPLLILHGWGSSSDAWVEVQEKLAPQGYRVCVPDLPGFGKSDLPPSPWEVSDYARFVASFAHRLGMERFFVVGHSFGGRIGIRLATLHSERMLGLVLCASAGIKPRRSLKHLTFLALAKGGHALLSLPLLSRLHAPTRKGLYLLAGERDYYRAQGVMRETMKKVIEEDLRPDLGKIAMPTLIVWGDRDRVTPLSDAHIMKKEIPNATLEIVEGAGHRLPYEESEAFTRLVLTFLGRLA
jgi:pimeloyl-ACP methyl ester carboxylesterase